MLLKNMSLKKSRRFTDTAAVMADWDPNAAGASEREALHKSILYPQGRAREVAELERLFDDKLGPHVR